MNINLKQAENYYNSGHIDEAFALLSDRTVNGELTSEGKSDKNFLLGKCYHKKNNDELALFLFTEAIKANEQNYKAYYARGTLLMQENKFADAYRDYMKITDNTNTSVQLHRSIGYCLYKMGRYNEALTEISTAIYYEKSDLLCQIINAKIKNKMELYQECIKDIEEFISSNGEYKDNKDLIEQKICALCESGDYDNCVALIENSISINNNLYLYKAKCCKEKNKVIDMLKKGVETDATIKEEMYFLLAHYYDKKEAINYYKEAIENDKRLFEAYIEIANIYISHKKYESALKILSKGEEEMDEKDEKQFQLFFLLIKSEVLFKLSKIKKAKKYYMFVSESLNKEYIETYFLSKDLNKILDKYFELLYINNSYSISDFHLQDEQMIGSGGFCQVFIGTLKGKKYAVKKYKFTEEIEKSIERKNLFLLSISREILTMEKLHNVPNGKCPPNCECKSLLLSFVCAFYINSQLYLITPLCSGGDLHALLLDKSIEISIKNRIFILLQVAKAIRHLHNYTPPYIHHDIKSLNVLLVHKYDPRKEPRVKLSDFGVTKSQTNSSVVEWTPAYAAPELINFQKHNESVDIYAFGVLIWEVFARDFPFKNVLKKEIFRRVLQGDRPEIEKMEGSTPNEIKELYKRCVAKEMNERPKIDHVIQVLNEIYIKC